MKTLIFIRSSFLLAGLMFTVACQNAKLDKKSPAPAQPVPPYGGQNYPPGQQGGPQQMPPGQRGPQQPTQAPVYPPPVDRRNYPPTESNSRPTQYRPAPEENRVGPPPTNRPRQRGVEAPVRSEPNIIPWFEKSGPYEKVVESCGPKCPPSTEVIVRTEPVQQAPAPYREECSVVMVNDSATAKPGQSEPYPPREMGRQPENQPAPVPMNIPTEMGKGHAARPSREGEPTQVVCPPVELKKRQAAQQLDLIFFVDNSASMLVEKHKIAAGMTQFAEKLGLDKDLNVAVVSANGPQGSHFAQVVGSVIKVKDLERTVGRDAAVASLAAQLKEYMDKMPNDASDAQGEVGLTATYAMLTKSAYLQQAKSQGLFRDKAALMVVYVSDENDVCYDYEKTGARPNYVYPGEDRGAQGAPGDGIGRDPFEARTFMANGVCKRVGPNGEDMSPDLVYRALRNLKGPEPIILSGILYMREGHIPEATGPYKYEKEKGRGYLDLIERKDLNEGRAFELSSADFGSHLAQMANLARTRMENETEITMVLPPGANVVPSSVYVEVKNAQGMVLKKYSVACATAGANCPASIGPAVLSQLDDGNGNRINKVSIAPEVYSQLKSGARAFVHYKSR